MTFRMSTGTVIPDAKIGDQLPSWEALGRKLSSDPNRRVQALGAKVIADVGRMKAYAAAYGLEPSGEVVLDMAEGVSVTIPREQKAHLAAAYGDDFMSNKDVRIALLLDALREARALVTCLMSK